MKKILQLLSLALLGTSAYSQEVTDTTTLRQSLEKATAAIRSAFEKGDASLVAQLHSPDIIKYFGGNNVIVGRDAVEKGAREWFRNSNVEFIENIIENTEFVGKIAIQTSIFSIKTTPKDGSKSSIGRGRSMVIYIQDKSSPTGWLTLREFVQEAPPK
ncbi:MAG: nuclear transport factor 2 family protein [Bacteroidota bacterium]|nr:nuclear transport factor 2 family protein [Bacteroidota bacterium]MDP4216792.1 nuclear transport factor 2 family protein [Bacteroidota bacterium]MDP4245547.1 nuclear transport factor 2 family protein [Bacteroidota bacterium]MDP4259739.1 nuclear transport factor 2 family protein [Bacteroidota bacterium]